MRQCISKQPVSVHNKILLERLLGSERVVQWENVCVVYRIPQNQSLAYKNKNNKNTFINAALKINFVFTHPLMVNSEIQLAFPN